MEPNLQSNLTAQILVEYLQTLETSRLAIGKEARIERVRDKIEQLLSVLPNE